ncbi:MAG: hypothetical protein KAT68_00625 [Bacteroidales bacterium]|nr:hypothetical protein [Bacteroidales bacterium]
MKKSFDIKKYNRVRSNVVSALRRKNLRLIKDVGNFIKNNDLPEEQVNHLRRLCRNIGFCAFFSLYSDDLVSGEKKYYSSYSCDNKNCNICNWLRQKRIRRKYTKWFKNNEKLVVLNNKKRNVRKIVTTTQYNDKYKNNNNYEFIKYCEYDVMSITLTVPHYKDIGFNGSKYYFNEIIGLFRDLYKNKEFKEWVYGGEYGIEATRTDKNGWNIHMHGLLLVKREIQNRNKLHKVILKIWNELSVNKESKRLFFSREAISKIKKSNKMIDENYINQLNPQGATMLTIETIYSLRKGEKVRTNNIASDAMMKAVREAISYHFEPQCFDKDTKEFRLDELAEILPKVYRKVLYRKFGCFYGEKELNVNYKEERLLEDLKDATEIIADEDTGEILSEFEFFICDPARVFHNTEKELEIVLSKEAKRDILKLEAGSSAIALDIMSQLVLEKIKSKYTNN